MDIGTSNYIQILPHELLLTIGKDISLQDLPAVAASCKVGRILASAGYLKKIEEMYLFFQHFENKTTTPTLGKQVVTTWRNQLKQLTIKSYRDWITHEDIQAIFSLKTLFWDYLKNGLKLKSIAELNQNHGCTGKLPQILAVIEKEYLTCSEKISDENGGYVTPGKILSQQICKLNTLKCVTPFTLEKEFKKINLFAHLSVEEAEDRLKRILPHRCNKYSKLNVAIVRSSQGQPGYVTVSSLKHRQRKLENSKPFHFRCDLADFKDAKDNYTDVFNFFYVKRSPAWQSNLTGNFYSLLDVEEKLKLSLLKEPTVTTEALQQLVATVTQEIEQLACYYKGLNRKEIEALLPLGHYCIRDASLKNKSALPCYALSIHSGENEHFHTTIQLNASGHLMIDKMPYPSITAFLENISKSTKSTYGKPFYKATPA